MSYEDVELMSLADDVAARIWTDVLKQRGDYAGWADDKAAAAKIIAAELTKEREDAKRLRKIMAFLPARMVIQASEAAGLGNAIKVTSIATK